MANSAEWQVQDLAHYDTFALNFTEDTALSASLLIPLDSLHRNTGAFRLVVYGGDVENVPFPIEDVFSDTPEQLKGLFSTSRALQPGCACPITAPPASGKMLPQ
jgi:hypothetical protein